MDDVAVRVFTFSILPVIIAAGHLGLDRGSRRRERRLEIFLLYLFGIGAAGSGIGGFFGHLYRHFPTRCSLIAAVFAETLRVVLAAVEHALDEPDAWIGFTRHVRTLCGMQAGDRALADLLTATIEGAPDLEQLRARAFSGAVALIERAQRRGELRADFGHEDLVLLLMANAGLLERTAETAPDAWQRHLDYVLDGLRPTPTTASPSPGKAAVLAAMNAAAHRFGCGPAPEGTQNATRR